MRNLIRIDLAYNYLESNQLMHLSNCNSLTSIILTFNRIGSISGLSVIQHIPIKVI